MKPGARAAPVRMCPSAAPDPRLHLLDLADLLWPTALKAEQWETWENPKLAAKPRWKLSRMGCGKF